MKFDSPGRIVVFTLLFAALVLIAQGVVGQLLKFFIMLGGVFLTPAPQVFTASMSPYVQGMTTNWR